MKLYIKREKKEVMGHPTEEKIWEERKKLRTRRIDLNIAYKNYQFYYNNVG